jgi:hypothetical protein
MKKAMVLVTALFAILCVMFLHLYITRPRENRHPNIPKEFYKLELAPYEIPWMSSGWYIQIRGTAEPIYREDDKIVEVDVYTSVYYGKLDALYPIYERPPWDNNEMRRWVEIISEPWEYTSMDLAESSFKRQIMYQLYLINPKVKWSIMFPKG